MVDFVHQKHLWDRRLTASGLGFAWFLRSFGSCPSKERESGDVTECIAPHNDEDNPTFLHFYISFTKKNSYIFFSP